jgi:cold shock CspA family protein
MQALLRVVLCWGWGSSFGHGLDTQHPEVRRQGKHALPPAEEATRPSSSKLFSQLSGPVPSGPVPAPGSLRVRSGLLSNSARPSGSRGETPYCEVVQRDEGYGFIQPDQGGKDVFVHISAVERSAMRGLAEGMKVSYDVEADRRLGTNRQRT